MEEKYSTIEQVAEHYLVSVSTVRAWIRQNMVPYLKVGGIYRLKISEIDAAFKPHMVEALPAAQPQVTAELAPAEAAVLNPDQDA